MRILLPTRSWCSRSATERPRPAAVQGAHEPGGAAADDEDVDFLGRGGGQGRLGGLGQKKSPPRKGGFLLKCCCSISDGHGHRHLRRHRNRGHGHHRRLRRHGDRRRNVRRHRHRHRRHHRRDGPLPWAGRCSRSACDRRRPGRRASRWRSGPPPRCHRRQTRSRGSGRSASSMMRVASGNVAMLGKEVPDLLLGRVEREISHV